MEKKKVLSMLLVAGMLLGAATGCGGSPEKATSSGKSDSGEAPSVELSLMSWHGDSGETKYYKGLQMVMDEYQKVHPNVTFKYIQQPLDGYMDLLDTQFISGGAADLIYMQPHMSRAFADKNVLLPLDEYMHSESNYAPGEKWVDTFSGGEDSFSSSKASNSMGSIMFVPMDCSAVLSTGQPFFYNKDLFKKAGIEELPTTYEEFLAALKQLKDAGINPVAGEFSDRHVSWSLGWISDQFGEHYMDQYFDDKYNGSDKGDLNLDKMAVALANDYLKADDPIFLDISDTLHEYAQYWQDGWTGASYSEAKNLFLMQEAAIFQEGFWAFTEYEGLITDFEWGVLPIPLVTKDTSSFAMEGFRKPSGQQDSGFNVNKELGNDPDKLAAAIDFLQYLTSQEIQQKYVDTAVTLSPIEGVVQPDEVQPFIFDTDLCIYEEPVSSLYVDYGDAGIWGGLCQEFLTDKTDTLTFNQKAIQNSKQKAIDDCRDKLNTLPDGIAEAETKLEELKSKGAAEDLLKAQENSINLLKLKLELYQQYCADL